MKVCSGALKLHKNHYKNTSKQKQRKPTSKFLIQTIPASVWNISSIKWFPTYTSILPLHLWYTYLLLVGNVNHILVSKCSLHSVEMSFMRLESIPWEIVFSHLICLCDFAVSVLLAEETSFSSSYWVKPILPDSGPIRFSIALDHSSD